MDTLIDKYIMGLYQNLEDEVIADIARRVKKTGRYTETAELMAKSMVEQGYSAEKIQAEVMKMLRADKAYQMAVAENTKAYKQEVQDIIDQTVKDAKKAGNELVAEAGNMAWNNDLSMWQEHGVDLKKPNNMSQIINAFQMQTAGQLRNLTKTMGFKNTVFGTTGVLNAYQREMDLALLKVATGAFSYDQAVNDCVHRLAQSGLRSIDYASGKTYQLDTAVRMSVRTGMSQLAGKVMEENLKSSGQDLVITSQHIGSRPEHAPWQNKVFSYSGKSKKYPDFFKETGYGTAAGLKGVNCTHDFYPFWEGASVIPDDIVEPDPVTVNGKEYTYYQATQKQRQMERSIRSTKREIEAQKAIGGNTDDLRASLRRQRGEYYKFSADVNIRPKDNRLRVIGGTSELKKNGQEGIRGSYKKKKSDIEKNRNRDTINLKENIEKSNSKLEELKKQFVEITEGYSYDEWFKEFNSIEEGYGEVSEGDELFEKLKALDKKIKYTEQKKTELLHQKERRKQLDTGYAGKVPDDKLDEFNKKAFEQIKLDTGYSDKEAEAFHDALKEYFGGDYDKILTGETQDAKIIRNGIDRMPVYEGTAYRGMTFSDYSDEDITQFTNLNPGDKLPSKGVISSWSSDKNVAESFGSVSTKSAESSSVILVCENNKTGVGVQHLSKFGEREAEVLSGSNYEVLEISTESKYDYVSRRSDLLYFPNDLEELESELKNQVVCIIKVKEV